MVCEVEVDGIISEFANSGVLSLRSVCRHLDKCILILFAPFVQNEAQHRGDVSQLPMSHRDKAASYCKSAFPSSQIERRARVMACFGGIGGIAHLTLSAGSGETGWESHRRDLAHIRLLSSRLLCKTMGCAKIGISYGAVTKERGVSGLTKNFLPFRQEREENKKSLRAIAFLGS
ncbi:uncharacterized protein VTP21DRAFT_7048 [Calcarisporiella thermophila]|uniref:uncharacterized protein n=1 Tax=Calcarisporiella thermophila TaxID=911321 RepID=UPI003742C5F1